MFPDACSDSVVDQFYRSELDLSFPELFPFCTVRLILTDAFHEGPVNIYNVHGGCDKYMLTTSALPTSRMLISTGGLREQETSLQASFCTFMKISIY